MADNDDFGRGRRFSKPLGGQRQALPRSAVSAAGSAPLSGATEPVRATRLDDASMALVREVLEGRRPMATLQKHAGDRRKALHLWAEALGAMHPYASVSGACSFCRKEPARELRPYVWRAVMSYNVLENGLRLVVFLPLMVVLGYGLNMSRFQRLDLPADEVVFSTHHGCCKGCGTRLTMRQVSSGVFRMSMAVVAVIAGIVALLSGLGVVGGIAEGNADRDMVWVMATVFGAAMMVVVGMLAGIRQVAKRLGLPDAVRPILRGGFVQDLRKQSDGPSV